MVHFTVSVSSPTRGGERTHVRRPAGGLRNRRGRGRARRAGPRDLVGSFSAGALRGVSSAAAALPVVCFT
eukprot:548410-Pyramimonas_sp.AAC.1